MKKTILMGSILAVFVLMMTPCIPAVQVQSSESSINQTLSEKTSLLFTDIDNAEDLGSLNFLVLKKLVDRLTDDSFQGILGILLELLRKTINRGLGLCYIIMSFIVYPVMLVTVGLNTIFMLPFILLWAWLAGIPLSEALAAYNELMVKPALSPAIWAEMFKLGVHLLVYGEWPLV